MGEFAKRLNQIMEEKGLRQVDLVEKTGIAKSIINSYCKGRYEPVDERLKLLATALNCDPLWLAGYDGLNEDEEQTFLIKFRLLTAEEKRTVGKILQYLTDNRMRDI